MSSAVGGRMVHQPEAVSETLTAAKPTLAGARHYPPFKVVQAAVSVSARRRQWLTDGS